MKYVSGRIVWGIYAWLGWSGEVAEPIGSSVPVRALLFPSTDILHSPAYEDGTDSEFRNFGN